MKKLVICALFLSSPAFSQAENLNQRFPYLPDENGNWPYSELTGNEKPLDLITYPCNRTGTCDSVREARAPMITSCQAAFITWGAGSCGGTAPAISDLDSNGQAIIAGELVSDVINPGGGWAQVSCLPSGRFNVNSSYCEPPAPPATCFELGTCPPPQEPTCEQLGTCLTPPELTCEQLGTCAPPPTCEQLGTCAPPPPPALTCEQLGTCPPPPPVDPCSIWWSWACGDSTSDSGVGSGVGVGSGASGDSGDAP